MRHGVERHNERDASVEPLSEAVLLILLSLAEQPPTAAVFVLKDVEEMSDGRVILSTGTLRRAPPIANPVTTGLRGRLRRMRHRGIVTHMV